MIALTGALALAAPGAVAVAAAQEPAPSTCALIDFTISWTDVGIQPIHICI
jgi:hypothetical protein